MTLDSIEIKIVEFKTIASNKLSAPLFKYGYKYIYISLV